MATVFKILYFPHVLLRKKSTPIEKITGDLKDFAVAMSDTMYAFEGIGHDGGKIERENGRNRTRNFIRKGLC